MSPDEVPLPQGVRARADTGGLSHHAGPARVSVKFWSVRVARSFLETCVAAWRLARGTSIDAGGGVGGVSSPNLVIVSVFSPPPTSPRPRRPHPLSPARLPPLPPPVWTRLYLCMTLATVWGSGVVCCSGIQDSQALCAGRPPPPTPPSWPGPPGWAGDSARWNLERETLSPLRASALGLNSSHKIYLGGRGQESECTQAEVWLGVTGQ